MATPRKPAKKGKAARKTSSKAASKTDAKPGAKPKRTAARKSRKRAQVTAASEAAAMPPPDTTPEPPEIPPRDTSQPETAEAETAPPRPAPPPKRRGRGRWTALLVIVVALGAVGAATWPEWSKTLAPFLKPPPAPPVAAKTEAKPEAEAPKAAVAELDQLRHERLQLKGQLEQLMKRIDDVESSVDTVKQMIRATEPPPEGAAADPSVARLSERLERIEKDGDAIKSILQRVEQLEQEGTPVTAGPDPAAAPETPGADTRALVLAVSGLKDAVASGQPFAAALDALLSVAGDDPEIRVAEAVLVKHAATGLATAAQLKTRFERLSGKIVQAARAGAGDNWLARAKNRLASLVTWRRIDEGGGETAVETIVVRAEKHLARGDLRSAVDAIARLGDAKARKAAALWLDDAKARLGADTAVATLHAHAVSLLTPVKTDGK